MYKPGNFLLSHTLARAVQSGLRGLTSVFGMGTGGSLSLRSPRNRSPRLARRILERLNIDGVALRQAKPPAPPWQATKNDGLSYWHGTPCMNSKFYGQAERAISNGKLNVLPRLHIRPIKLVVYQCSYYLSVGRSHLGEGFTLICIQRLS